MLVSNHYSTPPHEEDQPTQKPMDYESLDPNSRTLQPPSNSIYRTQTSPGHYASLSPSSSRRGSVIDASTRPPNQTNSPPSSPSHTLSRPSPLEHRPDLISTPSSPLHSPWRRDSLPSISQLAGELHSQQQQQQQQQQHPPHFNPSPFHSTAASQHHNPAIPPRTRHTSSPASLLLEDAHLRRHSIAITPGNFSKRDSLSYPSSTSSSTCSSPHHEPRYEGYSSTHNVSSSSISSGLTSPPPAAARRLSTQAPYSRSPELRVSHKLAERKRRKEMKDLFDDLRDLLPVDKGLKTSKWEILSKAVGYIGYLHEREEGFAKETEELRRELMFLKQQ